MRAAFTAVILCLSVFYTYWAFADLNFLHFAVLLFVTCAVILVAVSLTAPAPGQERLTGLAYSTTATAERGLGARWDMLLSATVVLAVVGLWLLFS